MKAKIYLYAAACMFIPVLMLVTFLALAGMSFAFGQAGFGAVFGAIAIISVFACVNQYRSLTYYGQFSSIEEALKWEWDSDDEIEML